MDASWGTVCGLVGFGAVLGLIAGIWIAAAAADVNSAVHAMLAADHHDPDERRMRFEDEMLGISPRLVRPKREEDKREKEP